jgi:hypothetical protein
MFKIVSALLKAGGPDSAGYGKGAKFISGTWGAI